MKQRILAGLFCLMAIMTQAQQQYLLLGTYTSNGSKGIYVYRFNPATAEATLTGTAAASNPSFLAVAPNRRYVYAVNENDAGMGMVSAFAFDSTSGTLHLINQQSSNGRSPCYVTTDRRGMYVFAGNYSSGNFSVFTTGNNGSLNPAIKTIQHTGSSVNTQRQQSAHVHATTFGRGDQYLYVPDLGMDKVNIYRFYWKDGLKDTVAYSSYSALPGSGPRHISFHPTQRRAYLMEELSGMVTVLKVGKNGTLKEMQRISSHAADYSGVRGSADIHVSPDGKFLYASNRGESNTLAIFSIHGRNGKLRLEGFQSTLGKKPRNFNFDPSGRYLLVANQDSNEVVIFERDVLTGMLTDTGKRINVPNPVCIQWVW